MARVKALSRMVNPVGMSQDRRGREPPLYSAEQGNPSGVADLLCRSGTYVPRRCCVAP